MKRFVLLQGDGMPDKPIMEKGGRTPLEMARTPWMDFLASQGEFGLVDTIPPGYEPQSDIGNLSLLGYDPSEVYTGRSPIEAASKGIVLGDDDVAFRLNLVSFNEAKGPWFLEDFSAGHIEDEQAQELTLALQEGLRAAFPFEIHHGLSYRHILVWRNGESRFGIKPPHDVQGQDVEPYLPKGPGAEILLRALEEAKRLLSGHPVNQKRLKEGKVPANGIWLWGQGKAPSHIKPFSEHAGLQGAVVAAVDLVKGIAALTKMHFIEVEGATGFIDTNYQGKAKAAIEALKTYPFVFLHLEAPDEAGHMGSLEEKIWAIERFDSEIVSRVVSFAKEAGDVRIVVTSDHATPVSIKTHAPGAVPFALWDPKMDKGPGVTRKFCEKSAEEMQVRCPSGPDLFFRLLGLGNPLTRGR